MLHILMLAGVLIINYYLGIIDKWKNLPYWTHIQLVPSKLSLTVRFNNSQVSHYSTCNSMGQPPEAIGTIKYVPVDNWIDFGSVPMSYQGQYAAVFTICSTP